MMKTYTLGILKIRADAEAEGDENDDVTGGLIYENLQPVSVRREIADDILLAIMAVFEKHGWGQRASGTAVPEDYYPEDDEEDEEDLEVGL